MQLVFMTPVDCTDEQIESFYNLVLEGEQVGNAGLLNRIRSCPMLGFAYDEKILVAVTAVKVPVGAYKEKIFTSAGVAQRSSEFPYEIGYAFTKKSNRGRGIHQQLVIGLIERMGGANFYATTKAANVPYILEKLGFKKTGNTYENAIHEQLNLYTYTSGAKNADTIADSAECIICREMKSDFNEEHVFPATIGGDFVIKLVCKECNKKMGDIIDTPFVNHKQILLKRHELGLDRQGRPIKNPFSGVYKTEDGKEFVVSKVESGFRANLKRNWEIQETKDGPVGVLTLSEHFMGPEDKLVEKYAKMLEEETGYKLGHYEMTKIPPEEYTINEIEQDNKFIMGCLKIGFETAVAYIPAYLKDDLAFAYSKMLHEGTFNRGLLAYINPENSLTREVGTLLNQYPYFVGFHCFTALLNVSGKGLVAAVKTFDMFYCFILSTSEQYIDNRIVLSLNDSIQKRHYSFFIKVSVKFDLIFENSELKEDHIKELTLRGSEAEKLFTGANGLTALYDTTGQLILQHVDQLMPSCLGTLDYHTVANISELEFRLVAGCVQSNSGLLYKLNAVKLYF